MSDRRDHRRVISAGRRRTPAATALVAALFIAACTGSTGSTDITPSTSIDAPATTATPTPGNPGCNDVDSGTGTGTGPDAPVELGAWQTTPSLPSATSFEQLATDGLNGQSVVKFSITDFFGEPTLEWLDSSFYTLHDEWFWFRLLNGAAFDGVNVEPVTDNAADGVPTDGFGSVAEVYAWAEERRDRLPLDLRFTNLDRLYSPQFYDLALDDPDVRPLALGSVIRVPAGDDCAPAERWLLELEYRDDPTPEHVLRYLDIVGATLPADIGDSLLWVPRSRVQELTADALRSDAAPGADPTIRYDEIVEPGTVEVYSQGVAAGRLLLVTDDSPYSLSDAGPDDIVVVQRTPDFLPPAGALITGTPQTPLAHVNVLALNRGIPNAFLEGLSDDIELNQLGRVRAPVAVRVIGGELDIRPLTDAEFAEWRTRGGTASIAVPQLALDELPVTIDLDAISRDAPTEAEIDELRPVIGGKAAGFFGLAAPGTVTMPDRPLAITVRPYFNHVAALDAEISAMLDAPAFQQSSRARFIVLEGANDFADHFDSAADQQFLEDFLAANPPGSPLGGIVEVGGLKEMIRDLPIAAPTLAAIDAALGEHFGDLSPLQGLRFRSSSSVEDIEGFNGAGLYSSNTGFIDPTALPDPDDHDRTVERALKRTWSSYWNAEAVEERYTENVDHRSGGMAVLVHPRFDDDLEISNGVATFTLLPSAGETGGDDAAVMSVNVQDGDTSVTNPDNEPGQAPEVVEVRRAAGDVDLRIERLAASTLVADGDDVLTDDQLGLLWDQLEAVTEAWRDRINAELPEAQRVSTLTLDFEFREMAAAWPAREDGRPAPSDRIIIKQARTLEPSLRNVPEDLLELDVPRDVLARLVRAERITCPNGSGSDDVFIELFTDPLAPVDMGHSEEPLVVTQAGSATRLVDDSCVRTAVFSSVEDYLFGLFDTDG